MKDNEKTWDKIYSGSGQEHKNEYPSELIIRFVKRNYSFSISFEDRKDIKVLDMGCGWGNNLKFIKKEGFEAHGIDFSQTAINSLCEEFPNRVICCDFTKIPYKDDTFEFCFDRSAIQHNKKEDILKIFDEVYRILKKGGKFYSIMMLEGDLGISRDTLSEEEIRKNLNKFNNVKIDYTSMTENNQEKKYVSYIIEATK